MSDVFSVAREFVRLSFAGEEPDPLTNLRLQKLLYYAQAWSLLLRDQELFAEDLQAWRHGPVVPDVYRMLPDGIGVQPIVPTLFESEPAVTGDVAAFLAKVWESYNQYSALKLSEMTHRETPWINGWRGRPKEGTGTDPIKLEDIEDYFSREKLPDPLAEYMKDRDAREWAAEQRLAEMPRLDVSALRLAARETTAASQATK